MCYLDLNVIEIIFSFCFEQMRLFPLIISILKKISNLVPGIEIPLIVLKKEAEAGG